MNRPDARDLEIQALRDRLTRMCEDRDWRTLGGRAVQTCVKNLRRKLGDDDANPTYIFTEPRVGFLMPKGEGEEEEANNEP